MTEINFMSLTCPRCGGDLEQKDGIYICGHCNKKWEKQRLDSYEQLFESVDEALRAQRREDMARLKRLLYQETHKEYISAKETKTLCQRILALDDGDFYANFYLATCKNDASLGAFLSEMDISVYFDDIPDMLDYLLKGLRSLWILPVGNLIERAYKMHGDMAHYTEYRKAFQEKATAVQNGIFEPTFLRSVFVAYSSKDMPKVEELVCVLEEQNKISCFVAARNLRHGIGAVERYDKALETAISNCQMVVFVSSHNSRSLDCDAYKELTYVRNHHAQKPRIEYLIEDYGTQAVEKEFGHFFDGREYCTSPKEVADRVAKLLIGHLDWVLTFRDFDGTVKYCVTCQQKNTLRARFCKSCKGEHFVSTYEEYMDYKSKFCKICGQRTDKDSKFCEACGHEEFFSTKEEYLEEVRRKAAEAERLRLEEEKRRAEEAERLRLAEEKRRVEEAERLRLAEEKRRAEEAERLRQEEEARRAAEAERLRLEEEKRKAEEAERLRIAEEKRKAKEEKRRAAEAERLRLEEEKHQAAEEAEKRKQAEKARKLAEQEEQRAKKQAEKEEREAQKLAEAEAMRLAKQKISAEEDSAQKEPSEKKNKKVPIIIATSTAAVVLSVSLFWFLNSDYANSAGTDTSDSTPVSTTESTIEIPNTNFSLSDENFEIKDGVLLQYKGSETEVGIPEGVTVIGEMAFYQSDIVGVTIPSSVISLERGAFSKCNNLRAVELPDSVVRIGEQAFYQCGNLMSVRIPNSVTVIGHSAFFGCKNLGVIEIPESVRSIEANVFSDCTNLEKIVIPDSVESIGAWAFSNCSSLEEVVVSDSVTAILNNTFYGCNQLKQIELPDSITTIGTSAFADCFGLTSVSVPNTVTFIGADAFSNCENLTYFDIPDAVTSIEAYTFRGCGNLQTIDIPDSVVSIGEGAFTYCGLSQKIELPDSVVSIGARAFEGCSDLKEIVIPDSVLSIESGAFHECNALKTIEISDSVASIESGVFPTDNRELVVYFEHEKSKVPEEWVKDLKNPPVYGHTIVNTPNSNLSNEDFEIENGVLVKYKGNATEVKIPNGVTAIGIGAFRNCSTLQAITIPASVTSVGSSAFAYCTGLQEIEIPASVTSIGSSAFSYCSNLKEVVISKNVTSMGGWVFEGCTKLGKIYLEYANLYSLLGKGWDAKWNGNCSATVIYNYGNEMETQSSSETARTETTPSVVTPLETTVTQTPDTTPTQTPTETTTSEDGDIDDLWDIFDEWFNDTTSS